MIVLRTADQWREGFNEAYEQTAEGPGRAARALLANCLSDAKAWTDELRDGSSALFAALAYDPKLIAPMRKVYRELHQHLANDDLPPGVAVTVIAAIDGMWLWWVLGLNKIDQNLVEQVRRVLESVVEELNRGSSIHIEFSIRKANRFHRAVQVRSEFENCVICFGKKDRSDFASRLIC